MTNIMQEKHFVKMLEKIRTYQFLVEWRFEDGEEVIEYFQEK